MGHEAGRELERFSVERVPKGTTAGPAAKQHTGTGLIERHVGLTEITMLKLHAELDRQGIQISVNDLARESVMSHNLSLNYGGATPSMAVFGVIPRPVLPGRQHRHHRSHRGSPDGRHTIREGPEDSPDGTVYGATCCGRGIESPGPTERGLSN